MPFYKPSSQAGTALRALRDIQTKVEVVHLVANGVRGDSRVIKSAQVSIAKGLQSLVLGISSSDEFEFFETEGVPVLLAPFAPESASRHSESRHAALRAWRHRERTISLLRASRAIRKSHISVFVRTLRTVKFTTHEPQWSSDRPNTLDISLAFVAVLDVLRPAIIHVHDALPLPAATAHRATRRLRHRTHVEVIYDAHECLTELENSYAGSPLYASLARIEAEYIREATQVITVSPEIARLLKSHYRLRSEPLTVANGPSAKHDIDAPSLRKQIGLEEGVPIAVYSGWVAPERGLGTVLRALTMLPDLHLALVVNTQSRELMAIFHMAHKLGVLNRVHAAPYVLPSQITQYLASADIGLIPLKRGRHLDLSLPTKFREYAHAGLPLVVSDCTSMAAEINRSKIGRVFKSGNVGGLALQIERVLSEPARYRQHITPALLDKYSWETQADKLLTVYARSRHRRTDGPAGEFNVALRRVIDPTVDARDHTESTSGLESANWQSSRAEFYHVKLGVGRANSAGQAFAWATAAREHLDVSATSFAPKHAICHPPHVKVRKHLSAAQGAAELARITTDYTYLLLDGFATLFGSLLRGEIEREIEILEPHMFGIALVAHGSEVRDPSRHARDVEGSYFLEADPEWIDLIDRIATRNRGIADRFEGPVFVATPDLLHDLPKAAWLPVVVDIPNWDKIPAPQFDRKLRILHRPSRSHPPIKGTDVIDPVLSQLHGEGLIEYIHTEDLVNAEDMPALISKCDVVVDQIRTGSYGVAAVEAMAAGRVVVGHVAKSVRDLIGDTVPIIDAPPASFEQAIRDLAQTNPESLHTLAASGKDYARRWHDGRESASVLKKFFLSPNR